MDSSGAHSQNRKYANFNAYFFAAFFFTKKLKMKINHHKTFI